MSTLLRLKGEMLLTVVLVFGTLFALISLVNVYMGYSMVGAVVMTVLFVGFQWWFSPSLIKMTTRMQFPEEHEHTTLRNTINDLSQKAGIPTPKLAIVPNKMPNAFVFGRTRGSSILAIHEGLLDKLEDNEVNAVLAHEIGHLKHNDCLVMTAVSAVPLLAYMMSRSLIWGPRRRDQGAGALFAVALVAYVIYFISQILVKRLSRVREYFADAYSGITTGKPHDLASALSKITYGLSLSSEATSGLRAFYIGDPSSARMEIGSIMNNADKYDLNKDGVLDEYELQEAMKQESASGWAKVNHLFGTHPMTFQRIQKLAKLEEEMRTGDYFAYGAI